MAEGPIYTTVLFQSRTQPPPAEKNELQRLENEKNTVKEDTVDKNARRLNLVCYICSLGVLSTIMLSAIIAVFTVSLLNRDSLLEANLRLRNLSSREVTQLERLRELEAERDELKDKIHKMEKETKELNISRAQWTIDAYCSSSVYGRRCEPCEFGWFHRNSNCFKLGPFDWQPLKTWEEAREECQGMMSDLLVEHDGIRVDAESWIGLRVEDGRWKRVNGMIETEKSGSLPTIQDHCATFFYQLRAVDCQAKKNWICQKKALTF